MSLTPWLPTVRKIRDGEAADQSTVNVPLDQLAQRDQHLYEKFQEISGKSALISFSQPVHPAETLVVNELSIVYFKSDNNGVGLARGTTGFSSNQSSSMFSPKSSNYSFGLVKTVYSNKTADLYTEGLCELEKDLDDPVLGLIQKTTNGVVEPFEIGPYFLSARSPGKITKDPSGIPVYIGYAISKRKFLLHTNVDEFSQFFINYRYHILDRVSGIPVLDGDTWTITESDASQLGWIATEASAAPIVPEGAMFYYNIPSAAVLLDIDNEAYYDGLTDAERNEAAELGKYLPPVPANFIQLYTNGILDRYNNSYDSEGLYSINEYGLWWHSDMDGEQPWSSDYPQEEVLDGWADIKNTISASRKRMFVSFSKFNPALRTQLVSSIAPLNSGVSNFIKFYNKDNPAETAITGDLLVDITTSVDKVGYDAPAFVYPETSTATYTSGRAVASLDYVSELGVFKAALTPVVAKLVGTGGINVTEQSPNTGIWEVNYASQGITGQLDSIEPINARLEFRGLSSYIKLPPPSTTPYGLVGKIVLPKGTLSGKTLGLVFHIFGDSDIGIGAASTNKTLAFQFEYSAVSASTFSGNVGTTTLTPTVNPVEFQLVPNLPGTYTKFTSLRITNADLSIPSSAIKEDTVVNFKLLRVSPAADSYPGNIGLLATYWETL